jgi:hypothetical protein
VLTRDRWRITCIAGLGRQAATVLGEKAQHVVHLGEVGGVVEKPPFALHQDETDALQFLQVE